MIMILASWDAKMLSSNVADDTSETSNMFCFSNDPGTDVNLLSDCKTFQEKNLCKSSLKRCVLHYKCILLCIIIITEYI